MKRLIKQLDAGRKKHEWYHTDGTLWMKAHFHHGKRHGVVEYYWSDGTLAWRRHYRHGVKRGLETWWDNQGRITGKKYHLVIR
jgi:antitoxin component YwqK of YwqJK toxin-antitoxin module